MSAFGQARCNLRRTWRTTPNVAATVRRGRPLQTACPIHTRRLLLANHQPPCSRSLSGPANQSTPVCTPGVPSRRWRTASPRPPGYDALPGLATRPVRRGKKSLRGESVSTTARPFGKWPNNTHPKPRSPETRRRPRFEIIAGPVGNRASTHW